MEYAKKIWQFILDVTPTIWGALWIAIGTLGSVAILIWIIKFLIGVIV